MILTLTGNGFAPSTSLSLNSIITAIFLARENNFWLSKFNANG